MMNDAAMVNDAALFSDRSRLTWAILGLLLLGALATVPSHAAEPSSNTESSPEWVAIESMLPDSVLVPGQFVYVDFWASWCPPCRKSFPWMSAMHSNFKSDELNILAVCLDRDASKGRKFVEESKAEFPVIYDPKAQLAKQFEIGGMPTSFLFDSSRQIISKHTGFTKKDGEELERQWRMLLKQSDSSAEGTEQP